MRILRVLQHIAKHIPKSIITIIVRIATFPYYRLYQFNTRSPLNNIAKLASDSPPDEARLLRALLSWRARKISELQFTTISCTVLAAAVIGAFSWTTVTTAHWLTHTLWHTSLLLAILGILLSASDITVLYTLGPVSTPPSPLRLHPPQAQLILQRYHPLLLSASASASARPDADGRRRFTPRRKMVFTWQAPLMFMAYSMCGFLGGLTVLVCTPLIGYRKGEAWGEGQNIAVVYLAVFAVAGTVFVFCSFWVYHYVDEEGDGEEEFDLYGMGEQHGVGGLDAGGWIAPMGGAGESSAGGGGELHYRPRGGNEAALEAEAKERAHLEGRLPQ